MKILFITQFLPYPPDTGGKIKTYRTIKILSKKHQVFLISFIDRKEDLKWEKELKKICFGLKTSLTPVITISHKKLLFRVIRGIFNPRPFRVQKYFLKEVAEFIKNLTFKEKFDAVHFDHETSVQYLPYIFNGEKIIKVYDEHNISSEGLFGYARYEKNLIEKVGYLIEGLKFRHYENKILPFFDKFLTISEVDRQSLVKRGVSVEKISFLPVPFKTEKLFHFSSKTVLFLGLLSWWPNQDAVLWFGEKIYPLIKKEIPEVKFLIIGRYPPKKIIKIAQKDASIQVKGYVKDKSPFLKKAGVFAVPIRAGAGVRIKILDALSFGLPVVSTKMALQGVDLNNGLNVLLADDEKRFAAAVIKILKNKNLAHKLSEKGRLFIKENYSLQKAKRVLDKVYQ